MYFIFRDLGDDLFPYFHRLFGALIGVINKISLAGSATNPELTGKLFECLSYLIRF